MHERDKLAAGVGAEADALLRTRAMAHALEHHVASQDQLDRPVEVTRSRGGDHAVRPGPKLAAKSRAKQGGNYAHVFLGNAQHLRQYVLMVAHRLRGLVKSEVLAIPHGYAGVQLDWVVSLGRRYMHFVHLGGSRLKGWFRIAPLAVDFGLFITFEVRADVRLFGAIGNLNRVGRGDCLFERKRHHGGDILPVIADGVVLEGRTTLIENP